MDLIGICKEIGKTIELPEPYHLSAVFQDNQHDEILGWMILDKENNPVSELLSNLNELTNWKNHINKN